MTAPNDAYFFKLSLYNYKSDGRTEYLHDVSLNYPSTDTDYHEGHVQSVTIPLGQTVYGGTLDVTNGTLTVDRAAVTIDSSTAIYGNPSKAFTQINAMLRLVDYIDRINCDKLATAANSNVTVDTLCITGHPKDSSYPGENWIYFLAPSGMFATLADLKAWIAANPLQVVYPLATPIEIQLDPVTISTISGQTNSVWADAGDVTVEFAADLKTYIDQKIAAAVAALS